MMNGNANSQNVTIPRFFHRDFVQSVSELQAQAEQLGSVKQAMVQRLTPYADKLPKGCTADQLADQIIDTANRFSLAESNYADVYAADVLKMYVETHTQEESFLYLSVLEAAFSVLDAGVVEGVKPMSAEELVAQIQDAAANPGNKSVAQRVDELADAIVNNSLKAYVFGGGNFQLLTLLEDEEQKKDLLRLAQQARSLQAAGLEKAESYAIATCACYEKILLGQVEGITVENVDPCVLSVLVSAGFSKGTILSRLLRGEIDRELADELLVRVENAVKWVLAVILSGCIAAGIGVVLTFYVMLLELSATATNLLAVAACLLGIYVALTSDKECERLAELLVSMTKFVISLPIKAGKYLYKLVKDVPQSVAAGKKPAQA